MAFKPQKDTHGRTIGYDFSPTTKQLRVVVAMNRDDNQRKSNEDILEECGVTAAEWKAWWNDYVIVNYGPDGEVQSTRNYFQEFWDSALQIKSGEERALLRQVGMQKAVEGDFRFWKEMAQTYGSVTSEPAEPTRKTIKFELPKNATPEQLREARQKLLESQRAVGDGGGAGLARLAPKRSPRPGA